MNDYFATMTQELFIASLEMMKVSTPGSPEFELSFQMLVTYKIYVDSKAARIIQKPIELSEKFPKPDKMACPFCSGTAIDFKWKMQEPNLFLNYIECLECHANGPGVKEQDYFKALEAWNDRL